MRPTKDLTDLFFKNLKEFNSTNFRTIEKADLTVNSPIVHKSFSSVLTRYFIFIEKHPDITDVEERILYFKLKLDQVAKYFSDYPDASTDNLVGFQVELKAYIKEHKAALEASKKSSEDTENTTEVAV